MDPTSEIVVRTHPTANGPGHVDTHSDETLYRWTAVLGPTAMLLAYRLAGDTRHGPVSYRVDDLAVELGVGPAKVVAALGRLHRQGVAVVEGDNVGIHPTLPPPREPKPANDKLTLTTDEAADLLGISRSAAYNAVATGEIPSVRIGRRILIPRARLIEMLNHTDAGNGIRSEAGNDR